MESFFLYLHEDKESYDRRLRYLDEMPVTREAAETIMEAIDEFEFLYYDEELVELLKTKYLGFLTEEEISSYLED